ncbi:YqcI/YcgG family protein [Falsibacillus albus]|uniref:YqcI/YcgG family protein n=1 Tax=Falsibacillus albus TaxID=2478915 RepID=A0A3L7K088_9BACI|nr:YqcI/YcgG family protein [Falsibacillus albus]RLQ94062.1 YqcI/YcgG family protein [Falsibacillus albus]
MAVLLTKTEIENETIALSDWQIEAFQSFKKMIADEENTYPCVPGRQGFQSDQLRFSFISDPRLDIAGTELAEILKQYGEISRETGKYASLVLIFETPEDIKRTFDINEYEDLFWTLLSQVSLMDEKRWPDGISQDPSHHSWEFCFHGEPYFAFCATPAHTQRKSRFFTHFLMAFQPRWVFEHMNDQTLLGQNMKKIIRDRLEKYDESPPHPALKWYGQEDNHEWMQYFLRDDETGPSKCPFHNMMRAGKK